LVSLLWTDGSIGAALQINHHWRTEIFLLNADKVSYIEREKEMQNGIQWLCFGSSQNHFRKCYLHQSSYDFYFRPEIQISSEEGLNAYGAVTWGNFYIKDLMKTADGCIPLQMSM
jgi:hypothetical protein